MQPLTRLVPRFAFDSGSTSISRTLRFSSRPNISSAICLRCRIKSTNLRYFANDSKPSIPIKEVKSNTPLPSNPELGKKSPDTSPNHNGILEEELPSASESRRLAITKQFSHLMDHMQGNIFIASKRINDLTGYSGIEALKDRISTLEARVLSAQEAVRSSRHTYKTTVADRASTQREVTTLLARKDSWTPSDLERFTMLYRNDHSNEQAVQEAATRLADAEREAEVAAGKLSSSILSRYHEEQIWSDKIRRMSTWGTWGLMGVNVLLFLVFQFGFEPWRRRRLVAGFEEKVKEALEREKVLSVEKNGLVANEALEKSLAGEQVDLTKDEVPGADVDTEPVIAAFNTVEDTIPNHESNDQESAEEAAAMDTAEMHVPTPKLPFNFRDIESWKATALDLWSSREVSIRKQDLTIIALEGAATGAAVVGLLATFILRRS